MADMPKVYLDHLIERENFRYTRPDEELRGVVSHPSMKLSLKDLLDKSRSKLLRKPDFQRATWAWNPEDCVSLLETLVNDQVVPSIIMWSSPSSGLDYILDGAHRVSVALAWLYDDWGDGPELDRKDWDEEQTNKTRVAAAKVRELVKAKIGTVDDYKQAEQALYKIIEQGGSPKNEMDKVAFRRGLFYQNLLKGNVGFAIQYVFGNYTIAENSFLKINKSGRALSEWEIVLLQNRDSSFGRTVMSIANVASAKHYWSASELPDDIQKPQLEQKLQEILKNVQAAYDTLFTPVYKAPIRSLHQPLLVAQEIQDRPFYLAELLTIVAGGKGQEPETEKLLRRDRDAGAAEIIHNGWELTNNTLDILKHITNPFPEDRPPPQTLALVAPVYFYSNAGRHVRGLLYGFIYWLLSGIDEEVKQRKRIFSAFRGVFEQVFLESKESIIAGFSRNIGSGPEVTVQIARYYNRLFELLLKCGGDISSQTFIDEYTAVLNDVTGRRGRTSSVTTSRSRIFTPSQKSASLLSSLLSSTVRCEICDGILDPSGPVQHDHIERAGQGGKTRSDNQRITHPFCNNHRDYIEAIRSRQQTPRLPSFADPDLDIGVKQLKMFDDSFLTS